MHTPNKDIGGYNKEMKASVNDKQSPKQHAEVSPKQMAVAVQLVGLYCQPAAKPPTQEGATASGETAKEAVLKAMKSQFYSV